MARDSSGNASRVVTPPQAGDTARSADYNSELADIYSMLSDSINKDGTKAFAANQSVGGFKFTNHATPSASTDVSTKGYVDGLIGVTVQGYDADLAAIAATSYSSGNMLLQKTAADTWSVTLAPSVTSVTASAAVTGATHIATVAAGSISYTNSNDNDCGWEWAGSNVMKLWLGGAAVYRATATVFSPESSGAVDFGSTTLMWGSGFWKSGAVQNYNNGNLTVTHISGGQESSGTWRARVARSSETGGTLTSGSANKYVNLATAPTLDGNVFTQDDELTLYNDTGSSMTITAGSTGSPTQRLAGTATTGNLTLAARGLAFVHFKSATEWAVAGNVS